MVSDQALDYGQAQACAHLFQGAGIGRAVEHVEHLGQVLGGDADAGVGHCDPDDAVIRGRGHADPSARACILDGVPHQVSENLLDVRLVRENHWQVIGHIHGHGQGAAGDHVLRV